MFEFFLWVLLKVKGVLRVNKNRFFSDRFFVYKRFFFLGDKLMRESWVFFRNNISLFLFIGVNWFIGMY